MGGGRIEIAFDMRAETDTAPSSTHIITSSAPFEAVRRLKEEASAQKKAAVPVGEQKKTETEVSQTESVVETIMETNGYA